MPDEVTELSYMPGEPKAKWPLSRIVLLALLAVAIGLLAMDWTRGRMPRDRAYNRLVAEMPAEEDDKPKGTVPPPQHAIGKDFEFWTTDKVHKILDRMPDTTDEKQKPAPNQGDATVTETYRFPGAFKNYLLLVIYDKRAHVAVGGPNTTMTSVRRTD